MSQQFVILDASSGEELGPFKAADLKRMAASGELLPTTLLKLAGSSSAWRKAGTVGGLQFASEAAATPRSPSPPRMPAAPVAEPLPSGVWWLHADGEVTGPHDAAEILGRLGDERDVDWQVCPDGTEDWSSLADEPWFPKAKRAPKPPSPPTVGRPKAPSAPGSRGKPKKTAPTGSTPGWMQVVANFGPSIGLFIGLIGLFLPWATVGTSSSSSFGGLRGGGSQSTSWLGILTAPGLLLLLLTLPGIVMGWLTSAVSPVKVLAGKPFAFAMLGWTSLALLCTVWGCISPGGTGSSGGSFGGSVGGYSTSMEVTYVVGFGVFVALAGTLIACSAAGFRVKLAMSHVD